MRHLSTAIASLLAIMKFLAVLLVVAAVVAAQEGQEAARDKRSGILLGGGIAPLGALGVGAVGAVLPAAAIPAAVPIVPGGLALGRGLGLGHGAIIGFIISRRFFQARQVKVY